MKVYFLRFTDADFDKSGLVWTSPVVDLYENPTYNNYSVTKSTYGVTGSTINWIGLERTESLLDDEFSPFAWEELEDATWQGEDFHTDTGKILNDRYIDTSGRTDLISYNVVGDSGAQYSPSLTVETVDDENLVSGDWSGKSISSPSEEIAMIDSDRYARFVLTFNSAPPESVELFVRVEIDRPVMVPLYRMSRQLLHQFPEWMAIREDAREFDEELELATPETLGGNILNAMAGEWLDDIRRQITYRDFQRYIGTVDLNQMAWCYKTSDIPDFVWSVEGDGIELARTANFKEFYEAQDDDACFIDFENKHIYTTQDYTVLTVNGVEHELEPHQTWNYIDEIGFLVDLERLRLENNESYQARILDVFQNRGGVGVESLKKALRRELNIWKALNLDVGSDDDTALPEILEIEDLEQDPKYFDPDGMPTEEFVELVERLSREYPTTWGRFYWNRAMWDLGGEDHSGYGVVPYRFDVEVPSEEDVQSGVGDGDDLYVFRPDIVTGPREFTGRLKIRGRERTYITEYPRVDFDLSIRGKADRTNYINPETFAWFTVDITTAAGTYRDSFLLKSKSDVDHGQAEPTPESYDIFPLFNEGSTTTPDLTLRDVATGEVIGEIGVLDYEDITDITLTQGYWDWDEEEYQSLVTDPNFEAWFSHDPDTLLVFDSATPLSYGPDPELELSDVIMKSLVTETEPGEWYSDEYHYAIKVNGVEPFTAPSPLEVDISNLDLFYDPNITNPSIEIQIETINEREDEEDPEEYGGITFDENDDSVFVPANLIEANGDNAWVNGKLVLADTTESIEFSTLIGDEYPITSTVWEFFEKDQITTFAGTVDEDGPWRNGLPANPGQTNFRFDIFDDLTRDDFDLVHDEDFVVTWMGVESDNEDVITWLEYNTVEPAHPEEAISYPENSIKEEENEGVYSYEPVTVYARVRRIDPEWNPQVHSGYFYDKNDEYYFYADRKSEVATDDEHVLESVAYQGAPIIVRTDDPEPVVLRQVSFFDDSVSPVTLTLDTIHRVRGTGINKLFLPHEDVYDVVVTELDETIVAADVSTETNELITAFPTERDKEYLVSYRLANSFYADHDHIEDGTNRTKLVFDQAPSSTYIIDYEGSVYDPATKVDLALNPFYTIQTEGFVFISHNEYTLDRVKVRLSSNTILSDGHDYIMITLQSLDEHGNPKPEQEFELSTTYGTLDKTEVITDHDGFAVIMLSSTEGIDSGIGSGESGTISITGVVTLDVDFDIEEPEPIEPQILAVVQAEKIQADGTSENLVYGRIVGSDLSPVGGIEVTWRKSRSVYDLFEGEGTSGAETTDENGSFVVGPFTVEESENAGYWFVALEATVEDTDIGDVVFWYEYPVVVLGVENVSGLPQLPVQMALAAGEMPDYSEEVKYPISYDEEGTTPPEGDPLSGSADWLPPTWYAIAAYKQYQLGIDTHKIYIPI